MHRCVIGLVFCAAALCSSVTLSLAIGTLGLASPTGRGPSGLQRPHRIQPLSHGVIIGERERLVCEDGLDVGREFSLDHGNLRAVTGDIQL